MRCGVGCSHTHVHVHVHTQAKPILLFTFPYFHLQLGPRPSGPPIGPESFSSGLRRHRTNPPHPPCLRGISSLQPRSQVWFSQRGLQQRTFSFFSFFAPELFHFFFLRWRRGGGVAAGYLVPVYLSPSNISPLNACLEWMLACAEPDWGTLRTDTCATSANRIHERMWE